MAAEESEPSRPRRILVAGGVAFVALYVLTAIQVAPRVESADTTDSSDDPADSGTTTTSPASTPLPPPVSTPTSTPASPTAWFENGRLILDGAVPDQATHTEIVSRLVDGAAVEVIVDRLIIDTAAPRIDIDLFVADATQRAVSGRSG